MRDVLLTIADTDSGDIIDAQRDATDANIAALERIGATQRPVALENPLISATTTPYVSGKKQIGNPAAVDGGDRAALFAPRASRTSTSPTS